MSRIRSTHPGLWTDERFVSVSAFARLLFMGLWNECDDRGAFEWSPLKLKMRLLPADSVDIEALLRELEQAGSLMRYESGGRGFGAVRNFCRYQRPKKPNALFPLSEAARDFVALDSRTIREAAAPLVPDLFGTGDEIAAQREEEGGRRDKVPAEAGTSRTKDISGSRPERIAPDTGPRACGSRLPQDFSLPADWADWAAGKRGWTAAEIADEGLLFANYWQSKAGRDGAKLDWFKTWQNWVLVSRRPDRSASCAPRQLSRDEQIARLEQSAAWFERHERADDAADCRARAARIRARGGNGPPRTPAAALPPKLMTWIRTAGANREGKNG